MTTTWSFPSTDPFALVDRLLRDADHLWGRGRVPELPISASLDGERLIITAELPGVAAGEVAIDQIGDSVTISATRAGSDLPEGARWLRRERPDGRIARTITLPFQADPEATTASLRDGILTLTVVRAAADRPRRVAVATA